MSVIAKPPRNMLSIAHTQLLRFISNLKYLVICGAYMLNRKRGLMTDGAILLCVMAAYRSRHKNFARISLLVHNLCALAECLIAVDLYEV